MKSPPEPVKKNDVLVGRREERKPEIKCGERRFNILVTDL